MNSFALVLPSDIWRMILIRVRWIYGKNILWAQRMRLVCKQLERVATGMVYVNIKAPTDEMRFKLLQRATKMKLQYTESFHDICVHVYGLLGICSRITTLAIDNNIPVSITCSNLTKLSLNASAAFNANASFMPPNLKKLCIISDEFDDETGDDDPIEPLRDLWEWNWSKLLTTLHSMEFRNATCSYDVYDVFRIDKLPGLTSLRCNSMYDCMGLTNLRSLRLNSRYKLETDYDIDRGVDSISTTITSLDLCKYTDIRWNELIDIFPRLTYLKRLILPTYTSSDNVQILVSNLTVLTQLHTLGVYSSVNQLWLVDALPKTITYLIYGPFQTWTRCGSNGEMISFDLWQSPVANRKRPAPEV